VHGANRLGGNSLLETIVFGKVAAQTIGRELETLGPVNEREVQLAVKEVEEELGRLSGPGKRGMPYTTIRDRLRDLMTDEVGIFRSREGLQEATEILGELREELASVTVPGGIRTRRFHQGLINAYEVALMVDLGEIITAGALRRKESRGSHFRTDFPQRDDAQWLHHTVASWTPDGPSFSSKPVTITKYPPKARTY
jgi:succinate dehydrogenase / fumarate reductase flavoprotein subunit